MQVSEFGLVLTKMAGEANRLCESHDIYLGKQNSSLLRCIGWVLQKGAKECIEICKPIQNADDNKVHYHITEYSGVAGQSEYVNRLPCSKCNWGH